MDHVRRKIVWFVVGRVGKCILIVCNQGQGDKSAGGKILTILTGCRNIN